MFRPENHQMPPWRICSIKVFAIMVLQYILQTYACAYVSGREWVQKYLLEHSEYPYAASLAVWVLSLVLSTALDKHLRKRQWLCGLMLFFFSLSQTMLVVMLGTDLFFLTFGIMTSLMMLSCCIALSLYACCLKENFTTLWSHVFVFILLLLVFASSVALNTDKWSYFLVSFALVSFWMTFVAHNLMALRCTL